MSSINKKYTFTDNQRWHIDHIIMEWWDAESRDEKRSCELACYKEFKSMNFREDFIEYLEENNASQLAEEMEHFMEMYERVPHSNEKRWVA